MILSWFFIKLGDQLFYVRKNLKLVNEDCKTMYSLPQSTVSYLVCSCETQLFLQMCFILCYAQVFITVTSKVWTFFLPTFSLVILAQFSLMLFFQFLRELPGFSDHHSCTPICIHDNLHFSITKWFMLLTITYVELLH